MAEEKKDQEQQGAISGYKQTVAPPPLASSKYKSVRQRFEDYYEVVIKDRNIAENNDTVARHNVEKAKMNSEEKCKMWQKLKTARKQYAGINKDIAIPLSQGAIELNVNIEVANKHFEELTGKMEESVACVKDLHKKMLKVQGLNHVFCNAINDVCNQKELKAMRKDPDAIEKMKCIEDLIDKTIEKTVCFSEDVTRAAGGKGLVNINNSLVGMGEEVKKEIDAFAGQVSESLASSSEQEAASYLLMGEALVEQSTIENELVRVRALFDSLKGVAGFVDPDNVRSSTWTMEKIIKEAEENMGLSDNDPC